LRSYYQDRRRYFWSLFAALVLLFSVHTTIVSLQATSAGFGGILLDLADNAGVAALALSLAFIGRGWWHSLCLSALLALLLWSYIARPLS